jgi:hypothetical protein
MTGKNGAESLSLEKLQNTESWNWPKDTGKFLLGIMRNDAASPEERVAATELGGDFVVVNDEILDALLSILANPKESEEIRSRAAISLGPALESADVDESEWDDEIPISKQIFQKACGVLKDLYADASLPKNVRRRILEASIRAKQDWHAAAIREAYSSGDSEWGLTAVFCMTYVHGFEKEILDSLKSSDPDVRYHAVEGVGSWQLEAGWPCLIKILSDPDPDKDLVLAAIESAMCMDVEKAVEPLEKLAESDDEDISEAAEEALSLLECECGCEDDFDDDEEGDEEEVEEKEKH